MYSEREIEFEMSNVERPDFKIKLSSEIFLLKEFFSFQSWRQIDICITIEFCEFPYMISTVYSTDNDKLKKLED